MVRYLEQEEKIRSRELWEEAFSEDSVPFVDFYYGDKALNNRILVREEDGHIDAMAQQNPYRMQVRNREWKIDYIVGVATRADRRHRGYMREILLCMLRDMYREGMPFCFLMPADRRIYEPFQFTYIFDQPQWSVKDRAGLTEASCREDGENLKEAADFADRWLRERFEVFCIRDEAYMDMFLKEIESEAGTLKLLRQQGELVGIQSEWGLDKRVPRELLCQEAYLEETGEPKPAIMARIVNLKEFLSVISLREECRSRQMSVLIEVEDPIIGENQGRFIWHLDKSGSRIEPAKENCGKPFTITVERLTGWLFGYERPEEGPDWIHLIRPLQGIFIDEIV